MSVWIGATVLVLALLAVGIGLGGIMLMLLWNWIAPIFWVAAPVLTFWQSVGINVLLWLIGSAFRSTQTSK